MFRRHATDALRALRPTAAEREASRLPVVVVLDNVRSAYNTGLVFRLCDCVNIAQLWLTGCTPYPGHNPHADFHLRKTGVGGSLDVLPWRHLDDPAPELAALKASGWRIVAVEQGAGSVPLAEADLSGPVAFIFGHERMGVGDALLALSDAVVELPVRGVSNSLNVALCASAVLYAGLPTWLGVAGGPPPVTAVETDVHRGP
ncbi:MAG: TrmH family RNA methyltransferase [Anaerolineae bacterium]